MNLAFYPLGHNFGVQLIASVMCFAIPRILETGFAQSYTFATYPHAFDFLTGTDIIVRHPGCANRSVKVNVCQGVCTSRSIPLHGILRHRHPDRLFHSTGRCCSIKRANDVSSNIILRS